MKLEKIQKKRTESTKDSMFVSMITVTKCLPRLGTWYHISEFILMRSRMNALSATSFSLKDQI